MSNDYSDDISVFEKYEGEILATVSCLLSVAILVVLRFCKVI